jgi:hypothetical protein
VYAHLGIDVVEEGEIRVAIEVGEFKYIGFVI